MLSENIVRTQMITKWNNYFQHNEIKAYDVIIEPQGQRQKEKNKLRIRDPGERIKIIILRNIKQCNNNIVASKRQFLSVVILDVFGDLEI